MSKAQSVAVKDLRLDLGNYRTVKQRSQKAALAAMIATRPDYFWALTESLLDDGFLPTENIIVLRDGGKDADMVVREGNRRVGAVKLILGHISVDRSTVPADILGRISEIDDGWKTANASVPCVVYGPAAAEVVDRIVRLAHGKGEKAGRDHWNAVARARHNREENGGSEPGLDLLEKYLVTGRNLTPAQAGRWSGDYPLTVLNEALKRIAPRIGLKASQEVAVAYPDLTHRDQLERVVHSIGQGEITHTVIRHTKDDFPQVWGFPGPDGPDSEAGTGGTDGASDDRGNGGTSEGKGGRKKKAKKAASGSDPQAVKRLLRNWTPRGDGREKVVDLRKEARNLDIKKTPLAFCFVLRSMFEISAKAYCADHKGTGGPSAKKQGGDDKHLKPLLDDVTEHLKANSADADIKKRLHGAMVELGRPEGLLSVTSMNQLVHNASFSIAAGDVCRLFGNVFPLLEAMNE